MEITTMNTEQVATLLGIKHETLLKTIKRYEERLVKLGCIFIKEGKGKQTLYNFTHISKEAKNMELAKQWEQEFGFKPRRPYASLTYYYFLTHEYRAAFMTDREVAFEFYGNKELRPIITMARVDLEKAGFIKPLNATETGYFVTTPESKEQVDKSMYSTAWVYFYERLGYHAHEMEVWEEGLGSGSYKEEDKEVQQAAGQIAWRETAEEFGSPKKIQKREATGKGWIL